MLQYHGIEYLPVIMPRGSIKNKNVKPTRVQQVRNGLNPWTYDSFLTRGKPQNHTGLRDNEKYSCITIFVSTVV